MIYVKLMISCLPWQPGYWQDPVFYALWCSARLLHLGALKTFCKAALTSTSAVHCMYTSVNFHCIVGLGDLVHQQSVQIHIAV